jgi:hypothetical protein
MVRVLKGRHNAERGEDDGYAGPTGLRILSSRTQGSGRSRTRSLHPGLDIWAALRASKTPFATPYGVVSDQPVVLPLSKPS